MPGRPFWTADNNLGTTKVLGPDGAPTAPLRIGIPIPPGDLSPATPAGVVFNPVAADFHISGNNSEFLFATEDGTISGWSTDSRGDFPTEASLAIDNSTGAAGYTGLAIVTPQCCREFLAVTNFHSGRVEPYTRGFCTPGSSGEFHGSESADRVRAVWDSGHRKSSLREVCCAGSRQARARFWSWKWNGGHLRFGGHVRAAFCFERRAECALGSGAGQRQLCSLQQRHSGGQLWGRDQQCV
jgi:hypothetical protein